MCWCCYNNYKFSQANLVYVFVNKRVCFSEDFLSIIFFGIHAEKNTVCTQYGLVFDFN